MIHKTLPLLLGLICIQPISCTQPSSNTNSKFSTNKVSTNLSNMYNEQLTQEEAMKGIKAYIFINYTQKVRGLPFHQLWIIDLTDTIFKYYFDTKKEGNTLPGHAELTRTWQPAFYDLGLYKRGICDICCDENMLVLGPKGCHHWGARLKIVDLLHGICQGCVSRWIQYGCTTLIKSHPCRNNEDPHVCRITGDGLYLFIHKQLKIINEKENSNSFYDKNKLEKLIKTLRPYKQGWDEIKKYQALCQNCKLYKPFRRLIGSITKVCPGCTRFYRPKHRKSCSVMHCDECGDKGVDISICFYCHRSKCNAAIICLGSMGPTWDCPKACLRPFQQGINTNRPECKCTKEQNIQPQVSDSDSDSENEQPVTALSLVTALIYFLNKKI